MSQDPCPHHNRYIPSGTIFLQADTSVEGDPPVDAPPEADVTVGGHVGDAEQPASVASEIIEGVRDELPEKEEDLSAAVAPVVDDDAVDDAPIDVSVFFFFASMGIV